MSNYGEHSWRHQPPARAAATAMSAWLVFSPLYYNLAFAETMEQAQEASEEATRKAMLEAAERGQSEGVHFLYKSELPDLRPGASSGRGSEGEVFMEDIAPGAESDKGKRILDTLKKAYESPADIQPLAKEYRGMMESERGPNGRATRAMDKILKEQRVPDLSPLGPNGELDPAFFQTPKIMKLDDPVYDSYFGDCQTRTRQVAEPEEVEISEYQTCQTVYAPEDRTCSGNRQVSFTPVETRTVLTIEAIPAPRDCVAEAEAAREGVEVAHCSQLREDVYNQCEITQCSGLEGAQLDECERGCTATATQAYNQCEFEARNGTESSCALLEEPEYQYCVANNQCDGPECESSCETQAEDVATQCEDAAQAAYRDAFSECSAESTGDANGRIPYSGVAEIDHQTIGNGTQTEIVPASPTVHLRYTPQPFEVSLASSGIYEYFTYGHVAVSDGPQVDLGQIQTFGEPRDGYRMSGAINFNGARIIEIQATLYRVQENTFDGCMGFMDTVADGYCKGNFQCTDLSSCRTVDGVEVCDSGRHSGISEILHPWHSTAVARGETPELAPRMCWSVVSDPMDCDFFLGEGPCYEAYDGETYCVEGDGSRLGQTVSGGDYLDDCAILEEDPQCEVASGPDVPDGCVGNAQGDVTGRCYVEDVVYDCGETYTTYNEQTVEVTQECGSPIRGMGSEYSNVARESSKSFRRAAVGLSALKHAEMDMQCQEAIDDDPETVASEENCTPVVFNGDHYTCKIPVGTELGLTPDCCRSALDAAGDVTFVEYIQLISGTYNVASHPMVAGHLAQTPVIGSAIKAGDKAVTYVGSAFRSAFESMANSFGFNLGTEAAAEGAKKIAKESAFSGMQQYMAQGVYDFLAQNGQKQLANSLFATNSSGQVIGLASAGQTIATILQAVQLIFLIYQVLKLIGHIVFRCEEKEIKLGFLKKTKSCHYVGKYCEKEVGVGPFETCVVTQQSHCCYKSPLSRIMAEEIRKQLPGGWGDPEDPMCRGFGAEQLSSVDWNLISLDEWEAMLVESEMMPGGPADAAEGYKADNVTPRRAIAGQPEVKPSGPDGLVDSFERNMELIRSNARPIEVKRDRLENEEVQQHDQELMPWYTPTTTSEDSEPPSGISFGDGGGAPATCSLSPPPAGMTAYDGVPAITPSAIWPVRPQEPGAANPLVEARPQPNEYVSIEFTPTAGQLSLWPAVNVLSAEEGTTNPLDVVVSVSPCPGDFSSQGGIGCAASGSGFTSVAMISGLCPLQPGKNYYINVAHGTYQSPGSSSCDDPSGCSLYIGTANIRQ